MNSTPLPSIKINFTDYLTEEEMRTIAARKFAEVCSRKSEKDFERILSNAAYHLVRKEVDAAFDGKMVEHVKAKSIEVIKKLSPFTVFKKPDAWDSGSSKAWDHLQAAMDEAKPLIQERVNTIIGDMSREDLYEIVDRQVGDAIVNLLVKGGEKKE